MPEPRRHRFLVEASQLAGDHVSFSPAQIRQFRQVLRLKSGDTVRVFASGATHDSVAELDSDFDARLTGEQIALVPESRIHLAVYPALVQRDRFEQILQKLTEVGAAEIHPVLTERSQVRSVDDSKADRWHSILREAAEQSMRGTAPTLAPAVPFQAAIDATGPALSLVAHIDGSSSEPLRDVLASASTDRVALFVGPEGGFSQPEIDHARRAGARLVYAAGPVLRTETASPVLSALVLFTL